MRFVLLDTAMICLAIFVDAGFATFKDLSSQLDFVTAPMNNKNNCNIVQYESDKSRRVTRSVFVAVLLAIRHGFDATSTIRMVLNDIYGRIVPMSFYTDSHIF